MKQIFVFDSTPLMYLAKVYLLEKVLRLAEKNIIPQLVWEEVVQRGFLVGKEDASHVDLLIKKGLIGIDAIPLREEFLYNTHLSPPDRAVLIICKKHKGILIADDAEIRKTARIHGIEGHGSVYLLFLLLSQKRINKEEFKAALNSLVEKGWYCSIEFYTQTIAELEKRS